MGVNKLPGGVTSGAAPDLASQITIGPDGQPQLPGYDIALNADGGYTATKKNAWYDVGVPLAIGGMMGYGALTGGAGLAGSAAASGGGGAATPLGTIGESAGWAPGTVAGGALASGPVAGAGSLVVPTASNAAGTLGGGGFWSGLGHGLESIFGGGKGGGNGVATGINTGLNVLGGYLGSRAANQAAQQQIAAGTQALNFDKQRYADAQANYAPYIANGQAADTAMSNFISGPSSPINQVGRFNAAPLAAAQNNGQQMVLMRAPNGETQQVPAELAPHYKSQGAQVVG